MKITLKQLSNINFLNNAISFTFEISKEDNDKITKFIEVIDIPCKRSGLSILSVDQKLFPEEINFDLTSYIKVLIEKRNKSVEFYEKKIQDLVVLDGLKDLDWKNQNGDPEDSVH